MSITKQTIFWDKNCDIRRKKAVNNEIDGWHYFWARNQTPLPLRILQDLVLFQPSQVGYSKNEYLSNINFGGLVDITCER